jgi:hypothetical protein
MPSFGSVIAVCAVLLAAGGSVQPVRAVESPPCTPVCRFTLERNPQAVDGGEVWVLTCHHSPPTPEAEIHVVLPHRTPAPALPATE